MTGKRCRCAFRGSRVKNDPNRSKAASKSRTAASPCVTAGWPYSKPLLRRRGHWRDSNVRKACIVERLAYGAMLLRVVHELGHRGKPGRLAFRHRDRNTDLLKCSISYA